jgi:hypothetical protein
MAFNALGHNPNAGYGFSGAETGGTLTYNR